MLFAPLCLNRVNEGLSEWISSWRTAIASLTGAITPRSRRCGARCWGFGSPQPLYFSYTQLTSWGTLSLKLEGRVLLGAYLGHIIIGFLFRIDSRNTLRVLMPTSVIVTNSIVYKRGLIRKWLACPPCAKMPAMERA